MKKLEIPHVITNYRVKEIFKELPPCSLRPLDFLAKNGSETLRSGVRRSYKVDDQHGIYSRISFKMSLTSRTSNSVSSARASSCRTAAPVSRRVSVVVRAEETATAAAPKAPPKPAWVKPTLNPDTPSPIFGGSTGGLLRKAQVFFPVTM
jgi:hypothetical protein